MEIKVRTTEPNGSHRSMSRPPATSPTSVPAAATHPPVAPAKCASPWNQLKTHLKIPHEVRKWRKKRGGGSRQREEGSQPGRDGEDEETDLQNRRGRRGIACAKLRQKKSPLPGKTRRGEPKMKNENRSNGNVAGKKWRGYE